MHRLNCRTWWRAVWVTAGALVLSAAAWAQDGDAAVAAGRSRDLGAGVVSTLLFGVIGILLAIVGFKLFDVAIRANIEKEIFENKNLAAAILAGFVVLGISIIVAATLMS